MTVIDMQEPGAREYVLACQLIARIRLERQGLRARGPAARTIARDQFGFRGNHERVQRQLEEHRDMLLEERQARRDMLEDAHLEADYEDLHHDGDV